MELGSFQWGLEPGQEASETNLNTRFPFNIRDFYFYLFLFFNIYLFIYLFIFTVWGTEHWNRLPKEAVESSSSEIIRNCLDMIFSNWL